MFLVGAAGAEGCKAEFIIQNKGVRDSLGKKQQFRNKQMCTSSTYAELRWDIHSGTLEIPLGKALCKP